MKTILKINPKQEKERIVSFLKQTFAEQKIKNAVIGLSGGIDSAVSLFLLNKALPKNHIFVAHLHYFPSSFEDIKQLITKIHIPEKNLYNLSIKTAVDACRETLGIKNSDQVRLGNVMARVRMIFLYDLAKKHNAMVVGTENKSEHLLGYFTRFGDSASDIEPIQHLYKTQVFELARYLGVPKEIIAAKPTANLWEGQTDEGEFGFSYAEADQVLYYYFEQKLPVEKIMKEGFINAKKIIQRVKENEYKHKTPYSL